VPVPETPVRPRAESQGSVPPQPDAPLRTPTNTYRVQLNREFTLAQLEAISDYLQALGVTDCYTSPMLTARAGSMHGYDILNHNELNPEIGTLAALQSLARVLREHDMGLVLDFVPNHMGIDPSANQWWRDVLENGPSSHYARYFDIDWNPVKAELRDKVLLPILGDQYGIVLERGELTIEFVDGALALRYFDRTLPLNPRFEPMVLGHGLEQLVQRLGDDHPDVIELREILSILMSLPGTSEREPDRIAERRKQKDAARSRLAALAGRSTDIAQHIERAVAAFNGEPGIPSSFDRLHSLLEVQAYRLAYWRTAFDEINYRRFFDVNELAGLRMEDPAVFADTHRLLLDMVAEGLVTGIRIDHPDGLYDPAAYFEALQTAVQERIGQPGRRMYVLAEKILGRGERLREDWQVHGTTGYGFLNTLNGLFVLPEGVSDLRRFYRRYTGNDDKPADTINESKKFMMRTAMASELNVLARALNRHSEGDRRSRDFTLNSLRRALVEVIASFPVYRTYITERGASADDIAVIEVAIADARRRNPVQEPSVFEFIRRTLVPHASGDAADDAMRNRSVVFAQKFQQYTAPVVAKGLEDTAFYRDVLLLAANEVGGDLRYRTRSVAEFHAENQYRLSRWPYEMTTSSTHDTKRGEDARARIRVISERSDDWRQHVRRWTQMNADARGQAAGVPAPDRNDEWMFYQSLVGAWPAEPIEAPIPATAPEDFVERMTVFMIKAIKEAKRHTSWLTENAEYEAGVRGFVREVLAGDHAPAFLRSFVPFQRRLAWFGMLGSLSELVLRLGSPGVPDVYQGAELWNFALVDPDNRRAVDFDERRAMLTELMPVIRTAEESRSSTGALPDRRLLEGLLSAWPDGRVKLYTLAVALRLRRAYPDLFLRGDYEPLGGDLDDPHLVGFTRRRENNELVVIVPRFMATFMRGVPNAPLGMERWRTASVRLPSRLASEHVHQPRVATQADPRGQNPGRMPKTKRHPSSGRSRARTPASSSTR
jgi:(1->4)-alpha-D-glucan 1-alpha-D-glucosylmutase